MASSLEVKFLKLWETVKGPALVEEIKFHPTRKWRADFAHEASKTLIEIEGGIWGKGRHTTGSGFAKDCEKYLEATLIGWRVVRLCDQQLDQVTVERIARMVENATRPQVKAWS